MVSLNWVSARYCQYGYLPRLVEEICHVSYRTVCLSVNIHYRMKFNSKVSPWVSWWFCNILAMWGTIWQLQMVLSRLWKWQTGLWDVELTWYSLSATHQICLYEYSLEIYGFKSIWLCPIVEILATWVKFF